MSRKTKFLALSFVLITPLSINAFKKEMVCLNAEAPASIVDELDDLSKTQDAFSVFAQSGEVGFGADNRYISTYQATSAPNASTMWENYGYIQYALSGQNILKVVADESTECPAPLVFASSVLEVDEISEEKSTNWTRRTYTYILPTDATYVRILPSAYNTEDESMAVWSQQITKVSISYVDEISDDLNDFTKVNDYYQVRTTTGDVGFGSEDSRITTNYQATSAPDSSTMWSDYGYIQYALSGQNLLEVVADESTKCPAPLVFASSVLEVVKVDEEKSSNWPRRTYTYILPTDATYVRILPSAYNKEDESMAVWSQQITKVNIKRVAKSELPKKDEPIEVSKFVDELDDLSKVQDAYHVTAQSSDVGFGNDTRYTGTNSPLEPANKDNWWNEEYPYIQYKVEGQNLVKIVVDTDKSAVSILPHIVLVTNYGENNYKVSDVNNYEVETSTNWSRITYTFVLEENASWTRVVFSVYDSYDSRLQRWMQQVTRVTLEHVDELPAKGEVPTIEVIKPDFTNIETIEDDCNELEGNTFYTDFYRVNATNGKLISFAEGTSEYTDSTWWEGTNGYVQIKLDRQNVLTINALVDEKASKYINPIGIFAGSGNQLKRVNVNNVIKNGVEDGYVKLTYVYILNSQVDVRLVFSSYNSPDGLIVASSQQITHIKAEYVKDEDLPTPDAIDTSHDTAKNAIDEFVNTLNKDAYSKENWDYILYYANKGKHELATSSNDDEIVNSVKESINNVKTLAQEANAAKEKELEEFSAYFNSLDQSRYTADNWNKISSLYNSAIAELEDITDIEQVKQIIADTKDDISKIEEIKDEPSEEPSIEPSEEPSSSEPSSSETSTSSDNNEKPSDNKKGCKGSAATGLVSLLLVAGITLKKKKR